VRVGEKLSVHGRVRVCVKVAVSTAGENCPLGSSPQERRAKAKAIEPTGNPTPASHRAHRVPHSVYDPPRLHFLPLPLLSLLRLHPPPRRRPPHSPPPPHHTCVEDAHPALVHRVLAPVRVWEIAEGYVDSLMHSAPPPPLRPLRPLRCPHSPACGGVRPHRVHHHAQMHVNAALRTLVGGVTSWQCGCQIQLSHPEALTSSSSVWWCFCGQHSRHQMPS
jgi:hypothetical protein